MPNILAHTYVVAETHPNLSPDLSLGSCIKDFTGMYKARFGGLVAVRGISQEMDAGIDCHQQTDMIFDAQPEKPLATQPLAEDLETAGLPNWPARLSAAFAYDVLLDRMLLEDGGAMAAFRDLRCSVISRHTVLDQGQFPQDFAKYVRQYFEDYGPKHYRDPSKVAAMIQHRLAVRSDEAARLVQPSQYKLLAEVLEAHAERVGSLGTAALAETISILNKDPLTSL